jgi:hypothetical protein
MAVSRGFQDFIPIQIRDRNFRRGYQPQIMVLALEQVVGELG